ncbi:uncharacterized protein LOC101983817 [Microtus ochrogaster]|uniref:Uncharacterized protein LOC101983817 n=1 Tax=Microtus ochrogaster TaxID=79684 RepID=A0ABM0L1I3_MICOH|nr:uncharacterized protein LOC101983817 [Microtus ochrogaster]
MESEPKKWIRSLAEGNGNSVLRLHRLTEELGEIEKGIKAESMEKVAVGSARQGGRRPPPPARATHVGGAAYLRGTLAEGVQAVGVGLPTPPPQQQRPLPGSIGRPCFPDSGRGGCTRPRLRGCPRRRLKGPSRCLKLARTSHAGPEITILLRASMSESPGPEPSFPGFAFLLPGLSGHYRSHSNRRADSLRKSAGGTHAG